MSVSRPSESRWIRPGLLTFWAAMALATHLPSIESIVPELEFGLGASDKMIHFSGFVFLTILLVRGRPLDWIRQSIPTEEARLGGIAASSFWANLLTAAAVAGMYAVVDEVTQAWGRVEDERNV